MLYILFWLALGVVAVLPFLAFAQRLKFLSMQKFLGRSLVLVALVYVVFALIWGNGNWLAIELLSLPAYGFFYWLAIRYSALWLALGWLLHPVWDVFLHLLGPGAHIVPEWYAIACVSFDVAVAAYVVYRVKLEQQMGQSASAVS